MRVLTTKQLAEFYGVDQIKIQQNYRNNKKKFVERKHYILLEGKELTEFKKIVKDYIEKIEVDTSVSGNYLENFEVDTSVSGNYIQNFDVEPPLLVKLTSREELTVCSDIKIPPSTRHLYLWTERGALLHAKSINTDKAWDVYEQLLDTYFRAQEMFSADNDSPVSQMSLPKVPNWHSINYKRIDNLCSVLGIDRKHMYHLILLRCSESYDLNEAKKMYKKERGFAPQYAIDIVGYFPELKEIADDYLDELELLYRREVRE